MPEALSSFLLSVSIIVALSLLVPCIESVSNLLRRRGAQQQTILTQGEPVKAYSSKTA